MMNATEDKALSTAQRVALAAHELLRNGQGQAITQRKIYEAIGNRGSMTTIQQALADWWTDLGEHLQQLEYLQGFPAEALTPLLEAFAGIREVAQIQARTEYETATREAQEAVATAQAERTATLEALASAKTQIQDLKHQVDQLVEKRDGLQRQLTSETDRRQAIEQQIPAIREDARVRIEQAEQQSEGLQAALSKEEARHQATETRLTTLYDQERTARAQAHTEAEKAQQALQGKLETLNQTYLQTKQEGAQLASQLRQEASRLSGQIEQMEITRQQLQTQLETCQAERTGLTTALAEAEADYRHDQERIRDLEKCCTTLEKRYATLEKTDQQKDKEILRLTRQLAQQPNKQES
jgi:chromosome segregation ATPase